MKRRGGRGSGTSCSCSKTTDDRRRDLIRPLSSVLHLIESPGGMSEHGVNLPGLRGEIGACHDLPAVIARDLLEQALELADIAVDRSHEVAVTAILAADLLERFLPLIGIELAREHVALAAVVAVPEVGRRVVVDHAGDVDGKRIERL